MLALELKPQDRLKNIKDLRDALRIIKDEGDKPKGGDSLIATGQTVSKEFEYFLVAIAVIIIAGILTYKYGKISSDTYDYSPQTHRPTTTRPTITRYSDSNGSSVQSTPIYFYTNGYKSVRIGDQTWMVENLNVDRFRNGDRIPQAKTNEEWKLAGQRQQPAWCYSYNNPAHVTYGKLYNWYAVNDPRGLAPEGWHVPSSDEWIQLTNYLGGPSVAGNKMKIQSRWSNKANISNDSGFSGLPGGLRKVDGNFRIGDFANWWCSSSYDYIFAWYYDISSFYESGNYFTNKMEGKTVRCIKN